MIDLFDVHLCKHSEYAHVSTTLREILFNHSPHYYRAKMIKMAATRVKIMIYNDNKNMKTNLINANM